MKTVLLIDELAECRLLTKWFLSNFGYRVDAAPNAMDALALFDPKLHDAVITDNTVEGMTGVELAHVIKLRSPSTPLIMYTSLAPDDSACIDRIVIRPSHLMILKSALDQVLLPKTDENRVDRTF